jgi:tRNA threonylcarbamoyladenosine biosynthesis protein TsaE
LGELARPGDVYLLVGDLGSGKTCLTQGIAQGLGVTAPVTSPTFILLNEYTRRSTGARLPLFHADLYRLDYPETEAVDLGLEEYLDGIGVCIIEWAERAPGLWPRERLVIRLRTVSETKRTLVFLPEGDRYVALVSEFRRAAFGI